MKPCLVVIDMQNAWLENPRCTPSLDDACEIVDHVAATFREAGHPVIWVQDKESVQPGEHAFDLFGALHPDPDDVRVHKVAGNAFAEAGLPAALAACEADFLVLCGFRAEGCVLATAQGAATAGHRFALLRDAVVSYDLAKVRAVEAMHPVLSWEVACVLG